MLKDDQSLSELLFVWKMRGSNPAAGNQYDLAKWLAEEGFGERLKLLLVGMDGLMSSNYGIRL